MSPSDTAERAVVATCAAMAAQWSIGSRVKAKNKERLINATHAVAMFLRAVRVTRLDKVVVLRIVRPWDVLSGATLDSSDALMKKLDDWIDKVWLTRKSSLGTLLAVIEAPRTRVEAVIARHPGLERLFHNEWVSLVVCEPGEAKFYHYDIMQGWQPVSDAPEQHLALSADLVGGPDPSRFPKNGEVVGTAQETWGQTTSFEQERKNQ